MFLFLHNCTHSKNMERTKRQNKLTRIRRAVWKTTKILKQHPPKVIQNLNFLQLLTNINTCNPGGNVWNQGRSPRSYLLSPYELIYRGFNSQNIYKSHHSDIRKFTSLTVYMQHRWCSMLYRVRYLLNI